MDQVQLDPQQKSGLYREALWGVLLVQAVVDRIVWLECRKGAFG